MPKVVPGIFEVIFKDGEPSDFKIPPWIMTIKFGFVQNVIKIG